jgi:hypothetical protein
LTYQQERASRIQGLPKQPAATTRTRAPQQSRLCQTEVRLKGKKQRETLVAPLPTAAAGRRLPPLAPSQEPSPSCIYLPGAAAADPNWPPEPGASACHQRAAVWTGRMEAVAAASSQHQAWRSSPSEANPQNPTLQTWREPSVRPSLLQSPSETCTPEAAAWSAWLARPAWPAWPPPAQSRRRTSPSRKGGVVELGSPDTADGGGGLQDEQRERAETIPDLVTAEEEAAGGGRSRRRRRALTQRRSRSRELPYPFARTPYSRLMT